MLDRLRAEPERLVHWAAIAAWIVTFLVLGPALSDGFDDWEHNTLIVEVAVQGVWFLGVLICLTLPAPVTLTAVRIAVPATIVVALWAAVQSDDSTAAIVGVVASIVSTGLVLSSAFGDRFIDGASYGDERRFALRPPGPVLLGILVPTWMVTAAGALAGPLLLGDEQWVLGAVVTALGWTIAFFAGRALNNLTQRFIVFVPNGLVVHDLDVMREPVLFQKREIAGIAPALADTTAADMTNAALGLALELRFGAAIELPVVTGRTTTEEQTLRAILVSPSRPASLLRVAQSRGFPIT
ncbi:MAG: hypothetical protein DHS20C19_16610 [Acidimicrobiales bacterium]|nr:MAG: hypothetical protein DHS20C19_16610 [Acidimicrobiales bacterium]